MKRYILHDLFNIYHFKADEWHHPVHNHSYHEIIFIIKGKGTHEVNGNSFAYSSGDIFLLGPSDYHGFNIHSSTEFCYIRFQELFFKNNIAEKDRQWQQISKVLLHTSFQTTGSLVTDEPEKEKLFSLLKILRSEYEFRHSSHYEVLRDNIMRTMMTILARNMVNMSANLKSTSSSIEDILVYLRQNLNDPSKLTIEHVASHFNYAPSYLSIFFKRHIGEALKQYIIRQRIKLIEIRLLYSNMALSEIAHEFGYTDESHLCKQFRKYNGVTPSQFRSR